VLGQGKLGPSRGPVETNQDQGLKHSGPEKVPFSNTEQARTAKAQWIMPLYLLVYFLP